MITRNPKIYYYVRYDVIGQLRSRRRSRVRAAQSFWPGYQLLLTTPQGDWGAIARWWQQL